MIKTLSILGVEGNFLKFIKNIILNGERLNAFPLKIGTREACLFLSFLVNIVLEVLDSIIR